MKFKRGQLLACGDGRHLEIVLRVSSKEMVTMILSSTLAKVKVGTVTHRRLRSEHGWWTLIAEDPTLDDEGKEEKREAEP